MEENIGERINVHRAGEMAAAGTETVASACPFCLTMMRDGLGHLGKESVSAMDVAEIVAQAIGPEAALMATAAAAAGQPADASV